MKFTIALLAAVSFSTFAVAAAVAPGKAPSAVAANSASHGAHTFPDSNSGQDNGNVICALLPFLCK